MVLCFSACESCEDPYAQFEYTLVCSEQLLEYATPEVTYTNDKGEEITTILTDNLWEKGYGFADISTYSTGGDNSERMHWNSPKIKYDDFTSVDNTISVKYIPKSGIASDSTFTSTTGLFHYLYYTINVRDDSGDNHFETNTLTTIQNWTNINIKQNVIEYINSLSDKLTCHAKNDGTIEVK